VNPFAPKTIRHDAYQSILDRVDLSEGVMGVGGAAHEPDTRDLQREMDPESIAAQEALIERDRARHAIWLSQLSAKSRNRMGIVG
jgi:hypothetical protein